MFVELYSEPDPLLPGPWQEPRCPGLELADLLNYLVSHDTVVDDEDEGLQGGVDEGEDDSCHEVKGAVH